MNQCRRLSMAKSRITIPRIKKPVRKTKSETYLINRKYMGDEPIYNGNLSNIEMLKAFNWYNTMVEESDAREYMEDFFKKISKPQIIKKLKRVPFERFKKSSIWIMRIAMIGGKINDEMMEKAVMSIVEATEYAKEQTEEKVSDKPTIQDRIKEKISDTIADIEGIIDDEEFSTNMYDWLKARSVPAMYVTKIIEFYVPILEELVLAYKGKDEQLKEAYRHLKKKDLDTRIKFFHSLIGDLEKYGDVTKKTRAPRKSRHVSLDKKLKHMKVQAESKEYKVASINPTKIIGAAELWAFNTKYKTLTVFRARARGGLDVSRSSIINYDESQSVTKRIGRKTEYFVDKALNGGKVALRKLMDEIKGEAVLQHRMNENTILLRVL